MKSQFSNRALVSLVAALGLVIVARTSGLAAGAVKPATYTVAIEGTQFRAADLTMTVGDSVVWVNRDPFPHTATSRAAGFDSASIAPDKSWKYVARKKGDFPYACTIHPSMTGTLHVK